MTNGDRIRAMTDEDLARCLSEIGCHKQANREICIAHDRNCEYCWLDFLRQDAKEDAL